MPHHKLPQLFEGRATLTERVQALHERLLDTVPALDRVAIALYDANDDLLKTFVNSTRSGEPLHGYEFKLAESRSLTELARSGDFRVLDNLPAAIQANTAHSQWLLAQGYRSSFTVPMYGHGQLLGFLFMDSLQAQAFTPRVQRDLVLFCNLINMALASELLAVRTMLASARVARDFAHLRDFETGAHLERMAHFARLIAKGVAPQRGLSDEFIEHVYLFAPLHDIGKIGIPDHILLKPGKLDPDERRLMETHVAKGTAILDKVIGDFDLQALPDSQVMRHIVACHHELLDGSGYPLGLRGDAVPLEARIVTVADIYDALTSPRPYKTAWPMAQALAELQRLADLGQLDADCVAALAASPAALADIAERFQDPA